MIEGLELFTEKEMLDSFFDLKRENELLHQEIERLAKHRQKRWSRSSLLNKQLKENLRLWHLGAIGTNELHDFAARYFEEEIN